MIVSGTMHRILLSFTLLGLCACAAVDGLRTNPPGDAIASELASLLTGVYNNHGQVWRARQQNQPAPEPTRVMIEPAGGGSAGERHLRFSQYAMLSGQDRLTRQVRWVLRAGAEPGTVEQSVYQQNKGAWRELGGCRVYWQRSAGGFRGQTQGAGCRFGVRSSDQAVILQRAFELSREGLGYRVARAGTASAPQTRFLRLARLVPYSGWAGVRAKDKAASASAGWRLDDAIQLHNQGGAAQLVDSDGQGLGYTVKLEQLVWPDSGIPMLRLSVLDSDSGEMLAYAWAEPGAERIGLNLGWLQVGLERSQ